jgi:hypothetical protein
MRRRSARREARVMATNVVALIQPVNRIDIYTDITNTRAAWERLQTLLPTLATQRQDALYAFLRAFAADLAVIKGAPGTAFVDTQLARFRAWKSADNEQAARIGVGLENRIGQFEKTNRNEVIELLTRQIAALNEEPPELESDKNALNQRIMVLQAELDRLLGSAVAKSSAATRKRKK